MIPCFYLTLTLALFIFAWAVKVFPVVPLRILLVHQSRPGSRSALHCLSLASNASSILLQPEDRTMCDLASSSTIHRFTTHSPLHLNEAGGPAMLIDISQVKTFVSSNLSSVKKTEQVATQLNCPLDKLKKTFYKTERVSLSRYIRESRVCRMKERLLTSEAPCKVICLDLGLREDVGARLFKNTTGMTMEGFRKSYYGATPRIWQTEMHHREEDRPGLRLVITEKEVRKALTKPAQKETPRPIPQSGGAWIQGPAH